ncbi:WSC domain-containing protein [Massariosphaeria phaeospora]|uniref:WSC domain-containing protein n=1 Tax=Massariosphaeria phaeospora TaxID=100035 RepID=A0A7C8I2V9_9PLEO|nr:WSC domain-containing protein [Massariosphaeria phaeospora]
MYNSIISITLFAASTLAIVIPSPAFNLPTGWEYSGCYTDSTQRRELNSDFYFDMGSKAMNAETCIPFCESRGFAVAGTEYSGECFCGPKIPLQMGTTGCYMPCAGDAMQVCGGPDRLTIYTSITTNPGPAGWVSKGCYTDNVSVRALTALEQVPGGSEQLTVAACTSTCGALGYTLAGVEYAGECFCGNEVQGMNVPFQGGCGMTCKGNSSEFCGGPNRLNLYAVA